MDDTEDYYSEESSETCSSKDYPNKNVDTKPMSGPSCSEEDIQSNYSDYDNESVCSGIKRVKELEFVTSTGKRIPPKIITENTNQLDNLKSKSTRFQIEMYNKLLKCRMKVQPILANVNSLPQKHLFSQIEGCGDLELTQQIESIRDKLNCFTGSFESILNSICSSFLEKNVEITGNEFLEYFDVKLKDCRTGILQDWFDKTRLSVAKIPKKDFSNFEKSPVVQIEQIMSDPTRLIRKTQMNRSNCRAVGQIEQSMPLTRVQDLRNDGTLYQYDTEMFDDSDFYQRQLSDFIKKKTEGSLDCSQVDKNYLDMRSRAQYKMDRPVDVRATKSRKIRYTVIKKLAGFFAPVDTSTWTDESMNELFGSLFGKTL